MASEDSPNPTFEWDATKAIDNLRRHGVSFDEAMTAFADALAASIEDPADSGPGEQRYILMGQSKRGRLLVVSFTERETAIPLISARLAPATSGTHMKKARGKQPKAPTLDPDRDTMRPEYDFTNAVRGKHAHLFAEGRMVRAVVLAPDVAAEFRSASQVNAALRRVLKGKNRSGPAKRSR